MTKKNLLLMNVLLLGAVLVQVWYLRNQWREFQSQHLILQQNPRAQRNLNAPTALTKPVEVANYSALVENLLFTADRNPEIPVETTATATPLAPKPVLMGTVSLDGDEYALMISAEPKDSKEYRRLKVGESLSGYTLVKILDQKVTMNAAGTNVEIRLNEPSRLVARDVGPQATTAATAGPNVTTVGGAGTPQQGSTAVVSPNAQGVPPGGIPVGTIIQGRKKTLVPSPFGPMEAWVDVK
jgi:hypothetical protein